MSSAADAPPFEGEVRPPSRVPASASAPSAAQQRAARERRRAVYAWVIAKLQAAIWVAAGALTAAYGRVFESFSDPARHNAAFSAVAWAATAVFATVMLYCVAWLPLVMRVEVPFDVYAPRLGNVAAAAGVTAFVAFVGALWPAFGWLTPLVVVSQAMGVVMSLHFIPTTCDCARALSPPVGAGAAPAGERERGVGAAASTATAPAGAAAARRRAAAD